MIKIGIIGGAGYTGGELLRILVNHPQAEIAFVHSSSNAGNLVADVHTDLLGDTDLKFTSELSQDVDVLFLCVGHGDARKFLESNQINAGIKIIDLSQDFRLAESKVKGESRKTKAKDPLITSEEVQSRYAIPAGQMHVAGPQAGGPNTQYAPQYWTYGLPELNREAIKKAQNIANPGCFATCIQLALLPLAKAGLLKNEIHVNATTGSTGAGQSLSATSHFTWRNNNLSVYKAFGHQHLDEITQSLEQLQPGFSSGPGKISFIPQRGDFTRGILAAVYLDSDLTLEEAEELYRNYYQQHPFTHVSSRNVDLKQVVNTNKCLLHIEKHDGRLFIVSIIDNLLKGACGQAVQNMNLMFGLEENAGLKLKGSAF